MGGHWGRTPGLVITEHLFPEYIMAGLGLFVSLYDTLLPLVVGALVEIVLLVQ